MVSSSLTIALLLALVPISLVATGEKTELYAKLFARDAPIMDAEEVPAYLSRILPYMPAQTDDFDEINHAEVQDLINANVLSDERCKSYKKFTSAFRNLATRQLFKKDSDGVEISRYLTNRVSGWNENIKNYISVCERKQLEACSGLFVESMQEVGDAAKQMIDEVSMFIEGESLYNLQVVNRMANVFGAKLKGKSMSQNEIEKEVAKMLGQFEAGCRLVERQGQSFKDLMESLLKEDKYKTMIDQQAKEWTDKVGLCEYVLHPVEHYSIRRSSHRIGEYILPQLLERISASN